MRIVLDRDAGIGLVPDTIDLAELCDPFHAWESADAAIAAQAHRVSPRAGSGADLTELENILNEAATALEEEFTTWLDADAADALAYGLIQRATELRLLQTKAA